MRLLTQKLFKFYFVFCLKKESRTFKSQVFLNLQSLGDLHDLSLERLVLQTQNIFQQICFEGWGHTWDSVYSLPQIRAFTCFLTGTALATTCKCSRCGHEARSLLLALLPTQELPVMTVPSHDLTCKPKLTVPCFISVCRALFS